MAYQRRKMSIPQTPDPLTIDLFGGLDYVSRPPNSNDPIWRTPEAQNFILDEEMKPEKCPGYKRIYPTSLGAGKINGAFLYRRKDATKVKLLHHGTKIYTWNDNGEQPAQIYNGLANSKSTSFMMNDKLYICDGTNYYQYDGTSVVTVKSVAYVPTTVRVRSPDGSTYETDEPVNCLTPYQIEAFNGDGVSSVYKLLATNLDADAILGSVDGGVTFNKVETTDFTVDRATGFVTVVTPSVWHIGTSNVRFKIAKTNTELESRILKCTQWNIWYKRVFMTGNPDFPNMDFMSEVEDPTYFPESYFSVFGIDGNAVKCYQNQYNIQIIIKGDDNTEETIYKREVNDINPEIAPFKITPVSREAGCIAAYSSEVTNNNATWLSQDGVKWLESTNQLDEKNVRHISDRVDKSTQNSQLGLLREPNLQNAISINFDHKYHLALNNKIYIFDYKINEWYLRTNVPASCFLEDDGYLYFGSNIEGLMYRFKKTDEARPYNDDCQPINYFYKPILYNFGIGHMTKVINNVYHSMKPFSRASTTFGYATEKDYVPNKQTNRMDLLDFNDIDFSNFTFETNRNPKSIPIILGVRDVVYFQPIFSNNVLDEGSGIASITIEWDEQGYVR